MEGTSGTSNNDEANKKEESRCFVCDAEIRGRYYALATCKTQNSRSRVIEKLGELVGERYMVVISEDDVICRSCANRINTLDRLEIETRNVRDHILRFLEQKYSLEKGELLGDSDKPKPCQPPQITKSNAKEITSYYTKQSEITDFETYLRDKKKRKRSHTWLQCDKCKYTTHLNSFMMHHIKDRSKQRAFCGKYGPPFAGDLEEIKHNCGKDESEIKGNEKDNSMIFVNNDSMEMTSLLQKTTSQTLSSIQTTSLPIGSSCDHLYVSNILLESEKESNPTPSKQQMHILQSVDINDINLSEKMIRISESMPAKKT